MAGINHIQLGEGYTVLLTNNDRIFIQYNQKLYELNFNGRKGYPSVSIQMQNMPGSLTKFSICAVGQNKLVLTGSGTNKADSEKSMVFNIDKNTIKYDIRLQRICSMLLVKVLSHINHGCTEKFV